MRRYGRMQSRYEPERMPKRLYDRKTPLRLLPEVVSRQRARFLADPMPQRVGEMG
jgi:hypothetical protein